MSKPIQQSLRLWPGIVIVALQWLTRFVVPIVVPEATPIGVMGGLVGGVLVVVWWLFFSRARPWERFGAVGLMLLALLATSRAIDESIATAMMGLMFAVYSVPILSLAFVTWAVVTRGLPDGARRASMAATILLASGAWLLLRTDGMTGEARHDFAWRWAETSEERLLADTDDEMFAVAPTDAETEAAWPGFRGPDRNSVLRGARIETDWATSPPVEMWRRPIGPGVSSFAVRGELVYTQEQRGDDEVVASYELATGTPVWRHLDAVRFWDSHAGAGPRGTPTLRDGRVYTLGGTGIVNVLDAVDGSLVWSRNAAADTDTELPGWGFASSPLVVDDVVIVAVEGTLVAYERATGEPRWFGPDGGWGYSSPHLFTIDGVAQVVLMSSVGATSVTPHDGTVLWEQPWTERARIVQPALTADGDLLISAGEGTGLRRVAVSLGPAGWSVEERWTSIRLKPYYSDFVVHRGHAFGFDGSILACVDVDNGERKWKGGRYGAGQIFLLADQDLLVVLTEHGELALVAAKPDGFAELARITVLDGKTWNHPVMVDDLLLVRNSEEMAAFRLPPPST